MAGRAKTVHEEAPRRIRDPVATRARIIAEAGRLFAECGFGGVSMPAIAAAAGITAGAIYKHFDGKAELFFHVIRNAMEASPPAAGGEGIAAMPAMAAAYAAKPLKRVRQMAVEVHYAAARDSHVRLLLRGSLDRDIGVMADALAAAQSAGEIDGGQDANLLATAVMVFIMGQMHLETLAPHLVGDQRWRAFVEDRLAAMIGLAERGPSAAHPVLRGAAKG